MASVKNDKERIGVKTALCFGLVACVIKKVCLKGLSRDVS